MSKINWRRITWFVIVPHAVYLTLAWTTEAPELIGVFNMVLISLSTAVCIAFAPPTIDAFRKGQAVSDFHLVAIGIFLAWCAYVLRTTISLLWRYFPSLKWIIDSDINTYFLFLASCAAVFHLAAPGSINGRIPPRRWVKIGCIVATAVFAALCLIYAADIQRGVVAHGGRWFLPYRPPLQVPQPL